MVSAVPAAPVEPAEIVFLDRETLTPETRLRAPDFPHRLTVHERSGADEVAARTRWRAGPDSRVATADRRRGAS